MTEGLVATAAEYKPTWRTTLLRFWNRIARKRCPSNLVIHAEAEMRRAGLYDKGADYDGMLPAAVMKLVKAHASEGHSGMSHAITLQIFNRVVNFKALTPISDDPAEWMKVGEHYMPAGAEACWQNRRESALFSNDGGKTYYSVDDEKREIKTSKPAPTPQEPGK